MKPMYLSPIIILLNFIYGNAFPASARHISVKTNTVSRTVEYNVAPYGISSTTLSERRWNFNEGRGPWGFKKNAEIWNGRAAQMGFTVVLLQELVTGKGVIAGIQEGDIISLALAGLAFGSVVGLAAFLASKGKDNSISY